MVNTILTPVTLWKDFDTDLPLEEAVVSERETDSAVVREVAFSGRKTDGGERVRICATYTTPKDAEKFPAIMVLFEAGLPFDEAFVERFVEAGYAVLCVDYSGEGAMRKHTVYPAEIDYANYFRAGRRMLYAEPTAKETSWYEWAAVARYAARYLKERPGVTKIGAIGLRTGGEVLFKIAPYAPIDCMVSVCAAGWLAYRGMDKFSDGQQRVFDEERHRFIAGIDSQSYAPHVKCPVLLISAVNDKKYDYDRVYDTFRQITAEDKAILFSAHGNGLIGSHSLVDIDLFFDKYLKERSVFICKPASISADEDEEGNLVVRGEYDPNGEITEYGVFYTERATSGKTRDWTRVLGSVENLKENTGVIPLSVYHGTDRALAYTFVHYSNGFSVTSKIQEIQIKKNYANSRLKSRVIYSRKDGMNGFAGFRGRAASMADCFVSGQSSAVRVETGYGGIKGVTADSGLVSYRVGEPGYEPPEGASFHFDVYAPETTSLKVIFYKDEGENMGYSATAEVEGGGKWKSFVFDANDFKTEMGIPMREYEGVVSVVFLAEGKFIITNVLWI